MFGRHPFITDYMTEKEPTMHDHQFTRTVFTDRRRDMERNLRHRMAVANPRPSRIRRAFGRSLIQIGSVIAAEQRLRQST